MPTFALDMLRQLFGVLRPRRPAADERRPESELIFRMRAWPQLPEQGRTAEVYRMLSVMSNRPVNRHWLITRFRMAPRQLDALLQQLVAQGSLEVIDPAEFARS